MLKTIKRQLRSNIMINKNKYIFGFEKLDVWKSSVELSKLIYKLTLTFPKAELFGLTNQMKRAVVSISSNIAEGTAKSSLKEQAKFMEIAFGSLMEVLNQIIIALELNYISQKDYILIRSRIETISRQLNALKNSQIRRYCEK